MGYQLLHGLIVLPIVTLPDKAGALARACYKAFGIFGDRNGAYGHFIIFSIELSDAILGQVPDPHSSIGVAKINVALVRMQHCTIDHDTTIVEIAHEPYCFEVENLESAILARSEEPFVVFLEFQGSNIP